MTRIEPLSLWVGHAGDGRAYRDLLGRDIRAVVYLALEEPPARPPRDLIVCRFPLVDGGGNDPAVVRLAVETVARLIEHRISTLVCCGAGMSRSPAVAAAAMASAGHGDPAACLARIAAVRPADVSPALWVEVSKAISG